jgi:DNA polymerase-1
MPDNFGSPYAEKQQTINNKNYYLIKNSDEIDEWIKEAEEAGEVAVDTETNSLDPHQADLIGVSLSSKIGKACYIPIGHKSPKCIDKNIVIKKIKPLLEDPSVKTRNLNIKFDFIHSEFYFSLGILIFCVIKFPTRCIPKQ